MEVGVAFERKMCRTQFLSEPIQPHPLVRCLIWDVGIQLINYVPVTVTAYCISTGTSFMPIPIL